MNNSISRIAMKRRLLSVAIGSLLIMGCQQTATQKAATSNIYDLVKHQQTAINPVSQAQQEFSLSQVSLTGGPFWHAQQTNIDYLLAMKPDRLLAPYLREAGLETQADSYGNWESSGLDGHIGGHYLSALSLAWAASGQKALKERLDYMLDELARAQKANGGYIGGIPNGQAMWREIEQGNINADLFSLNDRWVPLYNIDKLFHGLRDAYQIAGSDQARAMLLDLGEWMLSITENLSDEQIQKMLYSEHGGLNEVFADMALISQDARYLHLARQFSHRTILEPLTEQKDRLTGLHANTQIPKVIGYLKVAETADDEAWESAAEFFWQTVTQERSVSIGGNSVKEHFHEKDDFTPMVEDVEGPETCNTYNMMKLSKMLYLRTGEPRYLAFYERAMYNHILSSQHPEHGGLVYFTSMRPGHYRMYSSIQDSMWCCVGSGIENHSKYGELAYTHSDSDVWVNLYLPSTLSWQQKGWRVETQTTFPDSSDVTIKLQKTNPDASSFTLHLRKPDWLSDDMQLTVNGKPAETTSTKAGFITVQRQWRDNDIIRFQLPAEPAVEQLPDGQDYYSVLYGPVVLATKVQAFENEKLNFVADDSRMGHIAAGPVCPPEALPVMLGEPASFLEGLKRAPGDKLAFVASTNVAVANQPERKNTTLIPFFRLHDSRYEVYWPQLSKSDFSSFVENARAEAATAKKLRSITVDTVSPGQQQPEVEHNFKGEHTRAGVNDGHHWRDATGWFSYELNNEEGRAKTLRLTYFKGDTDRQFSVLINNQKLASVTLPASSATDTLYTVDYALTDAMQKAPTLTVRFEAHDGSVAGGIYGIRLLSE